MALSPEIPVRMTATIKFLIFMLLIIYMLNAPGIHLKLHNLYHSATSRSIDSAAFVFDLGLLFFSVLVFIMLFSSSSDLGLEEIFSLWASVLLASSGAELAQGRSAYVSLLSTHDKAMYYFIHEMDENEQPAQQFENPGLKRGVGILLMGTAAVLFVIALIRLIPGS